VIKRLCHCSSERYNDHVIEEQCHVFSYALLDLCHFASGLRLYSLLRFNILIDKFDYIINQRVYADSSGRAV
jgi:hypothetical protein